MTAPTELGTAAEVLLATSHDPFARASLRRPVVRGWARDGAVVWQGTDPDVGQAYLSSLGPPAAVAALLADLLPELPPRQRVTLPRGTARLLPAWVGLDGVDWEFRWTPSPFPLQPGEERVRPLPPDAGPEVAELLSTSSPRATALPGDEAVREWVGLREDTEPDGPATGRLLAVAADTSAATGVGHLSSISVRPGLRGRGLGSAVTSALTRRLFAGGADIVTLGLYADNVLGRALYDRLGWRDEHRFTSGALLVRSRW